MMLLDNMAMDIQHFKYSHHVRSCAKAMLRENVPDESSKRHYMTSKKHRIMKNL